jgi:hypothetical protein
VNQGASFAILNDGGRLACSTSYLRYVPHNEGQEALLVEKGAFGAGPYSDRPQRLSARGGKAESSAMGPYSANVIEPIMAVR